MHPIFHLLGIEIPAYGLMALLGGALGSAVVLLRRRRFPTIPRLDAVNMLAMCFVGILVGAKALFIITNIPKIIANWDLVMAYPLDAMVSLFGGLVFYGGVLGGFTAVYLYIRKYRIDLWGALDLFAPAIPAGHMLGRIGCYLGGCCYGMEVPWGVTFTESLAPGCNGVPRMPVQLYEAGINLLIFLVLLLYERKPRRTGRTLALYLLLYAPARFVLECFRGDVGRGVWLLSTSQWLSILLFVGGLYLFLRAPTASRQTPEPASAILDSKNEKST